MADDTKRMNVLYSSDDNYAQHMGVSIYSLLRHNAEFENIRLYVIDNDISPENRDKLREMVSRFSNAEIMFLPFLEWKEKLRLNMSWDISISSYARLFVGEMLPETVDRVLYADCDMIVCEPLRELWNTPLDGKVLAAVQDGISADTKAAVGLQAGMRYFNAGLLLIDLAEWRARKMGERCMSFIEGHGGNVVHHDQGGLNGVQVVGVDDGLHGRTVQSAIGIDGHLTGGIGDLLNSYENFHFPFTSYLTSRPDCWR